MALARGLNASVLHRWVKPAERSGNPIAIRPTVPSAAIDSAEAFVSALPFNRAEGTIRIKGSRGSGTVSIESPASAAHERALLPRQLMRCSASMRPVAVEPLHMRAGTDKALARVVGVFGEARAHHAYPLHQQTRQPHEGARAQWLWSVLCARKLYEGGFYPAGVRHDRGMPLSHEQPQAIAVGLPWERRDEGAQ